MALQGMCAFIHLRTTMTNLVLMKCDNCNLQLKRAVVPNIEAVDIVFVVNHKKKCVILWISLDKKEAPGADSGSAVT